MSSLPKAKVAATRIQVSMLSVGRDTRLALTASIADSSARRCQWDGRGIQASTTQSHSSSPQRTKRDSCTIASASITRADES
jgi:hypothetical protein